MKKILKPIGLVLFVALAASLVSSTADAQRLSRGERVVVDFLVDGTLSSSDLTRSQQQRLTAAALDGLDDELFALQLEADILIVEFLDLFEAGEMEAAGEVLDAIDIIFGMEFEVIDRTTFQIREVLFESPRRRRAAFSTRQLIRRGRRAAPGAAFEAGLVSRPADFPFILGEETALNAALVIVFEEVRFNPIAIINNPATLRNVVDSLRTARSTDVEFNENENSFLVGVNLRRLAGDAIMAFVDFFDDAFGL